jgi:DDE family transposase
MTELPVSILPRELQALMESLPPGVTLPWEILGPMALQRTPLANATLSLWSYLLQPSVLDGIFEQHRGRSFEDVLKFSTFVDLIRDALVLYKGSGRGSFQNAEEQGELPTCQRAVYGKLGRIPISLSLGFFEDASERIRGILPQVNRGTAIPASLSGMTVTILDGKQLKKVAKRLKPLRCKPGKVVGGKILVAYLPAEGVAVAMAADLDGEANDIRLMPELVPRARARILGPRLWVADRQFCDLNQPTLLTEQGDHFLIRRSLKTHFHADPQRPAQTSVDAQGRTVIEEWGWIGAEKEKRRRYVRQIRLIRPGEEEILLVTDLLDSQQYPASDLLEVYLTRWEIERVFQQITEVFELRHLIGSMPQATIFQAAFCLVLYNLLQVIRAYVAASQEMPVDAVSVEQIFEDVQKQLTALTVLFPSRTIADWFTEELSQEEIIARLRILLGTVWTPRYRKAINKRPRPKVKKAKGSGAHTSVHKVLEAERTKRLKAGGVP